VGTCRYVDRGGRVLRFQRTVLGDAADVSHWYGCRCRDCMDQFDRQSRWLLRSQVCWGNEGRDWELLRRSVRSGVARVNLCNRLRLFPSYPNRTGIACGASTRRTVGWGVTVRRRVAIGVCGTENLFIGVFVQREDRDHLGCCPAPGYKAHQHTLRRCDLVPATRMSLGRRPGRDYDAANLPAQWRRGLCAASGRVRWR